MPGLWELDMFLLTSHCSFLSLDSAQHLNLWYWYDRATKRRTTPNCHSPVAKFHVVNHSLPLQSLLLTQSNYSFCIHSSPWQFLHIVKGFLYESELPESTGSRLKHNHSPDASEWRIFPNHRLWLLKSMKDHFEQTKDPSHNQIVAKCSTFVIHCRNIASTHSHFQWRCNNQIECH